MKRVFAFFVAVVLILPLCGCSRQEPTLEEYSEELRVCFKTYTSESADLSDLLRETSFTEKDVDRETAEVKAALDAFREITPPEKYKQQHEKLCQSLDMESRFQDATAEFCKYYIKGAENLTLLETAEVARLTAEMEKLLNESEFPSDFLVLTRAVADDLRAQQKAERDEALLDG